MFNTNNPPLRYPFPTKSHPREIIILSASNTRLRPTLLKSAPETKFLRREGKYKTLFKDNVFPEVNLSKTFPLPITTAVVESAIYTHSLSVDSSKSCNNSSLAQKCLEAPVSSTQTIYLPADLPQRLQQQPLHYLRQDWLGHYFVLPSLSLALFFVSIWKLCDQLFHKQNKSP